MIVLYWTDTWINNEFGRFEYCSNAISLVVFFLTGLRQATVHILEFFLGEVCELFVFNNDLVIIKK